MCKRTQHITSNNVGSCWPTMVRAFARGFAHGLQSLKAVCKRTQQLPALLRQQCWNLQCIVGRIQPISLCKPCVMSVRGPKNVGIAMKTDPILLCYASAITEQKSCWLKSLTGFKLCATKRHNIQQHATGCANERKM